MVGRLRGSTKDPNRRRILNPEGRRIDLGGPQYNNWIKNGYKVHRDETKLVIDRSFTGDRNATRPVGRPKGKAPAVPDSQKVKNPETGRLIKKGAVTFRNLTKKYLFNEEKNKFITKVLDPKQNSKISLNSPDFRKRLEHGYIYDKLNNSLTRPSKKFEVAFGKAFVTYDLDIMSKDDPIIQMDKLNPRVKFLVSQAQKKMHGLKFSIGMDVVISKPDNNTKQMIVKML